jgi:molybdopterin-guanine dinucleotide biosynthesis protein A
LRRRRPLGTVGPVPADPYDVIVLAGGRARRLGGLDKAAIDIGGRTSLDRVLDAVPSAARVVVVGEPRDTARDVVWAREDPPYAGPPTAVVAALPLTSAGVVVLLGCDYPLLDAGTVARLLAAQDGHDAAWLVDRNGREQYLLGAYRRGALHEVGSRRSLRSAFAALDVVRVEDLQGAADDIDDWAAVARVRARAGGGTVLKQWTEALAAELGVALEVDERLLLEVARDAAHSVARPAAPLTTFLVGYAAALSGGDAEAVARASATAQRLAAAWAPASPDGGTTT